MGMLERVGSRKRWCQRSQQKTRTSTMLNIADKSTIQIQLLDLTIISPGTLPKKTQWRSRMLRGKWQSYENGKHFVFKGEFRPLSYFLCLVYARLLCLAPSLRDLPMPMGQTLEHLLFQDVLMFDGKQRRNMWKRLMMNRLKERLFSYFNLGRTGASSINQYMSSGYFS